MARSRSASPVDLTTGMNSLSLSTRSRSRERTESSSSRPSRSRERTGSSSRPSRSRERSVSESTSRPETRARSRSRERPVEPRRSPGPEVFYQPIPREYTEDEIPSILHAANDYTDETYVNTDTRFVPLSQQERDLYWGGQWQLKRSVEFTTHLGEKKIAKGQIAHVNDLLYSFTVHSSVCDTSQTGTGKTLSWSVIAFRLNLPKIIVFTVPAGTETWNRHLGLLGLHNRSEIYTYGQVYQKNPKHGLLVRQNDNFLPAIRLQELCMSGVLIVFDEYHSACGTGVTTKACGTIIDATIGLSKSMGAQAYVGLVSATPADKDRKFVNVLKGLGLMGKDSTLNSGGFQQCCHNMSLLLQDQNPEGFQRVSQWSAYAGVNEDDKLKFIIEIWSKYLRDIIYSEMILPANEYDFAYGLYEILQQIKDPQGRLIDNPEYKLLKQVIERYDGLEEAASEGTIRGQGIQLGELIEIMQSLEGALVPLLYRIILRIMKAYEGNVKIVIWCRYMIFKTQLFNLLKEREQKNNFRAEMIIGGVDASARRRILDDFNQNPYSPVRVLICDLAAGGQSVDMHDTIGVPRVGLTLPSIEHTRVIQSMGRIFRHGAVTEPVWRVVFPWFEGQVPSLIKMMFKNKKESTLMKDVVPNRDESSIPLFNRMPMKLEKYPGSEAFILEPNTVYRWKDQSKQELVVVRRVEYIEQPPSLSHQTRSPFIGPVSRIDYPQIDIRRAALDPEQAGITQSGPIVIAPPPGLFS